MHFAYDSMIVEAYRTNYMKYSFRQELRISMQDALNKAKICFKR